MIQVKKWILHTIRSLYFVAGFIFALHQITPHAHHEDLSSKEDHSFHEEKAESFQDLLQLIFHTKVSQDDFSQLLKSEQKVVKHLLSLAFVLPETFSQVELSDLLYFLNTPSFIDTPKSFSNTFLLNSFSFRGPPSLG